MVDPTIFKHELAVGATALSDDVQHSIPHLYGAVILLWYATRPDDTASMTDRFS